MGAKAEIYRLMRQLAKRGTAIIMISSELPEIIGMSDRILVMYEGEIIAEESTFKEEELGLLMAGSKAESMGQRAPSY